MRISIHGKTFEQPDRYAEGHVVNANEAAVLNQTFMENIGNNFRSTVKEWTGTDEELQAKFNEYASAYAFGTRVARGPAAPSDPVGAEAHRLALVFIKKLIQDAGKKVGDYTAADLNESARQLVEQDPSYREQAEASVRAMEARTEAGPSIDLSALLAKAKEKTEAAADESAGTIVGEAQAEQAAVEQAVTDDTQPTGETEAAAPRRRGRG